jgi:UDP-glucuronate 4-epimerase
MKKILVTGSCGFIGYHIVKKLLFEKFLVVGIDNMNNYYSVKIKKARLKDIVSNKNFSFINSDISNYEKLDKIFKKNKFDIIINLAAQAGVNYSMTNPEKYLRSNILGFFNICKLSNKNGIKKIIYASSSSVYGDNKKLPVKENYYLNPLNYYAITKVNNEQTAKFFSEITKIKFIGLRFFSIYGSFGRPDMLIYKILNCVKNVTSFNLNNYGRHTRDFTYIDDVSNIIYKLLMKDLKSSNIIFNICNSMSVSLNKFIKILNKNGIYPKTIKRGFQKGDIKDSLGSNMKLKKLLNTINFTKFDIGLKKTLDWYKTNSKIYDN